MDAQRGPHEKTLALKALSLRMCAEPRSPQGKAAGALLKDSIHSLPRAASTWLPWRAEVRGEEVF